MTKNSDEILEAKEFLKRFTYDPQKGYPRGKMYLYLNKSFKELKFESRQMYTEDFDIILSNSNHRELIFHKVYCILTPKEYFMVYFLLKNAFFNNENFSQTDLKYSEMVKYKCRKSISKKKLLRIYPNIKKLEGISIPRKLIRKIKNNPPTVYRQKKVEKSFGPFSSKKSEVYNIRNKIKTKIEKCMEKQNIYIDNFDEKFEHFIGVVYMNYEFKYPNPNSTVRTSYNYRIPVSRVHKSKKNFRI